MLASCSRYSGLTPIFEEISHGHLLNKSMHELAAKMSLLVPYLRQIIQIEGPVIFAAVI